jgi:hypothetical protein
MRINWIALAAASLVSLSGLVLVLSPLLRRQVQSFWPWAPTNNWLLLSVPVAFGALVVSLTLRQLRLTAWRRSLDTTLQARIDHFAAHADAMIQDMQAMEIEIESRREVERTLQAMAETLQRQVDESRREADRQEQHLLAVKRNAAVQNARLRQMNKMAHEFVGNISHEFRTPLTVIREYTEALNDGLAGAVTAEQRTYLDTIIARVDDLIVMVDDVLDMSRLEANLVVAARRVCSVGEILAPVRGVLERKAAASGVLLRVDAPADTPAVFCDPEKAGRVIVNLAMNAIKFSDPGQEVELWCRHAAGGAEVLVGVSDHGPGIAPEHLERIFDSFEQLDTSTRSSTKGFGLGLTIVRELVRLNFGRVDVQSASGAGSVFTFTLPLADPRRLLPLFVQRARERRGSQNSVGILAAAPEHGVDGNAAQEIGNFLMHGARRTDLVYPGPGGRWLLVAVADRDGAERLLQRLSFAWPDSEAAGRAGSPALRFRLAGCFDTQSQLDDCVRTFLDQLDAGLPDAAL